MLFIQFLLFCYNCTLYRPLKLMMFRLFKSPSFCFSVYAYYYIYALCYLHIIILFVFTYTYTHFPLYLLLNCELEWSIRLKIFIVTLSFHFLLENNCVLFCLSSLLSLAHLCVSHQYTLYTLLYNQCVILLRLLSHGNM